LLKGNVEQEVEGRTPYYKKAQTFKVKHSRDLKIPFSSSHCTDSSQLPHPQRKACYHKH